MKPVFDNHSALSVSAEIDIFRAIVTDLTDGVVVADPSGRFLFFNSTAERILGIGPTDSSPEEWTATYGCYLPDGVTPYPPLRLPLARALTGEIVPETEILIRNPARPAGTWILARANPLWSDEGKIGAAVVVFRNITKKKRTDTRIRVLMNAVEQTADSILITNRDGLVEYVNPAFEKTTGYSPEEILGRTPALLKSGVHDEEFYSRLWSTISAGGVFRATIANRKKNGEIYFAHQTITPMKESSGDITHYVSVVKDVTEQKKLEEQDSQLALARAVQQQFYRVSPPQIDGLDIAAAAFPAYQTGGDYFDFISLPQEGIGLSLGDVCGHGIGSALLMVHLRAFLRAFSWKSPDPGEVFTLLNDAIICDLEDQSFATLVFCRMNPISRTFSYASAGHVPGYILDVGGGVRRSLDATDVPLGLFPERTFCSSEEIQLHPGETLVLLTDGITEAQRPDQGEFGTDRTLQYLHDHRNESAQEMVTGLYRAVRDFSNGLPQADDITALICKCLPET
jgi:PAS domain S-box-containing protein